MTAVGRPRSCDCGECDKCKRAAYMREWWNKWTPEQKRAKTAQRNPDRVREADRLKMAKRRREGMPEQLLRIKARDEVRKALLRGDMVRGTCEVEGCDRVGHAHHDDYTKPLAVRWLCRVHHEALHESAA